LAILSQVIENIEESLKSQAMFMDSKNSYLITMSDFQKPLRDFKVICNNWEYAEAEIRSKAASVMNLKLMVAIDYAAQCNRDTVELLEEIIELQNNKKLMKRIEALGSSSIETDNIAEIADIKEKYGITLKGFSSQDYYMETSNTIFSDINRHPKFQ
jgi:hypothetical protein